MECKHYCAGLQEYEKDDVELLNPNKKAVHFSAGEVIIKQGSLMDYVFFLKKGLAKLIIETEQNRNIILEIVTPERFIGVGALYIPDVSPISFVALTDCEVCQIRKQFLMKIFMRNASFSEKVIRDNGQEYHYLFRKLSIFGARNNHGRLADTLLYLNDKTFSEMDIYASINRKELAELSAMSMESMNKILKEFKEDLIIEIEDKRIKILRPDLLERISRVG